MGREYVINNRALEEFLESLLRWGELCEQLRELYYRYLDLAAFRSEKCFFPGRKCKRPWGREYDMGDLTLMWTYILNTAPLCGKLIKTLTEVEYKIRLKALESLEKYGGTPKKADTKKPRPSRILTSYSLKKPVGAYLVLFGDKLYVIWGRFENLPRSIPLRSAEIERRIIEIIQGKNAGIDVSVYEVDREFERLWFEITLPKTASKLFGKRDRVPVILLRSLGWLLSDDSRLRLKHEAANLGQAAIRLFDWIAMAEYVAKMLKKSFNKPIIFKISVYQIGETKSGKNPKVSIHPIGTTNTLIEDGYRYFGITLSKTNRTIMRGYKILKTLKELAFRKRGKMYVVDDVKAWIAFSAIMATLLIGDGSISSYQLRIAVKSAPSATIDGLTSLSKELARAIDGTGKREMVALRSWHIRLLLPSPPTPVFKKVAELYKTLTNYPAVAVVQINGTMHMFTHMANGNFVIKRNAAMLYEIFKRLGINAKYGKAYLSISYTQLKKLKQRGIFVRLLNEVEKGLLKEVKPVQDPDLETVKRVLEEVMKIARVIISVDRGREYIRIVPYSRSKMEETVTILKNAGIRISILRRSKEIRVYDRYHIELIRKVMPHVFSQSPFLSKRYMHVISAPLLPLHFLCQSGADAVEGGKPIHLYGGYPALYRVEPAVKTY